MDNSKEITLTAEGRQKLVDELAYREGELRDEIVERLKEARSFGDLSENSEYDAAKEEQSQNESKIAEIRQTLSVARVVEDAQHGGIRVSIGTTVELEDERGKKTKFTIVGTTETNSLEHKISNESPAGQALIGCGKGDQVEFTTPAGKTKSYTIVSITR
ncbi:transcription elongation factor GreA [Olsenella sp. AF16-14LB]|jgi:transcription elongation factor GreA|uniref:transcription elongation factor GreA n=1 Tax=Atopobiaceae TaxID=1643824 RepID=UPI000509408D|nr:MULTISPECIES: transcription elongation factor GreA [unclassified Olsenella]RGJ45984.1 transcription elongation factor GreA [Olsenella sp. TM06-36]RGS51055.1 transcription elongation factor GreA [Olsenella sp. AF21-51]RGU51349.1 transcription elongation factor GreA [Olsenella sp. AF16-14LB]RGU82586.1 transcription elongation factor GreA [Olsenella sp. AF15-43LB]RHB54813.1 transcription elongation factor GreA [Olsenella sp. AM39-30AC]